MRIAVVGATGPTGQEVVTQGLARGHEIVAYVRRPEALGTAANLKVIGGQLADTEKFATAISGCDVLICTIGTRSFKERNFMSQHIPMVSSALKKAGLNRMVLMGALGGGDVPAQAYWFSKIIFKFMSKYIFGDRTVCENDLDKTGIKWAAVYPAFLTNGPKISNPDVVEMNVLKDVWGMQISRATVASVLLDLAEDETRPNRKVAVTAPGKIKYARS